MKILSLDSATESASCALLDDEKLLGEITFNYKKQHSIITMPMIDSLLKNTGTDIKDIDGFVVSKGPGSFTGLRIGMATIKGLSQGLNKPLISISSLDALAHNLAFSEGIICPIMDALRNNVYTALYKFEENKLVRLSDYMAIHIDELLEKLKKYDSKVIFIGDGTYKFKDYLVEKTEGLNIGFAPTSLNLVKASSLGELGLNHLKNEEDENIFSMAPIYLRKSQAEREYEEKHGEGV
ncbi:tRNA (adenosine(37)-N6)-threonylcarbamoyltransferase complex dimerization subunit type 1 TsaB [Hathewaya massiliensis]|uniref:tRNA (adenosine(37)-N6)-threonylcarbamoyltransferase complex dimerization subunit type 1 TsaB n=1 Tax=Hathewaya massiliensis TaxID=1964382 RepID=UPI00115AD3D6|nr:tRNA (adenosine(37)-N6)-threonylcarbamoyltransferase complex dimerization subunit type 1 TsaB [Hathewaya massiliensis]